MRIKVDPRAVHRVLAGFAMLMLAACGGDRTVAPTTGGGPAAAVGSDGAATVEFRIAWPERDTPARSRVIPDEATAVVIFIEGDSLDQALRVDIPRPDQFYGTVTDRRITLAPGWYQFTAHAAVGLPQTVLPNPSVAFGWRTEQVEVNRINTVSIELYRYLKLVEVRRSTDPPWTPPYEGDVMLPVAVDDDGQQHYLPFYAQYLGGVGVAPAIYSAFYHAKAPYLRQGEWFEIVETGPATATPEPGTEDAALDGVSVVGGGADELDSRYANGHLGQVKPRFTPTYILSSGSYSPASVPEGWSALFTVRYSTTNADFLRSPSNGPEESVLFGYGGVPFDAPAFDSVGAQAIVPVGTRHFLKPHARLGLGDQVVLRHDWSFAGTSVSGTAEWVWEAVDGVRMPLTPVQIPII